MSAAEEITNLARVATQNAAGLAQSNQQHPGQPASATDVWSHSYTGMVDRLRSTVEDPVGSVPDLIRSRVPIVPTVEGMVGAGVETSSPDAVGNSLSQTASSIGDQWNALGGDGPDAPHGTLATIGAGFALLTSIEQLISAPLSMIPFPALPAIRVMDFDVGLPHGHTHPPNLVPPAPMVPLPSTGPIVPIPILSGATRTLINGMPAARCGDMGLGIWCGGYFPIYEVFLGSSSVWIEGARAGRVGVDITKHCTFTSPKPSDPPLGPMLGFTVMSSANVLIGGVPMPSLTNLALAAAFKALFKGLGAVGRAARRFSRRFAAFRRGLFGKMESGFLKCKLLRAEPVNVATGEVQVEQEDFSIPGRIPIEWSRRYSSQSSRVGVCGHGWETLADARLELADDGSAVFFDGTPGAATFPSLPYHGPVRELVGGARLLSEPARWVVERPDGRRFVLPLPAPDDRELPVERIEDPAGNSVRFVRERGELREIVESCGRRIVAESRGGLLRALRLQSGDGQESRPLARYEYDAAGNLVAALDPLGHPYRFAYRDHRMAQHTDRRGLSFYYEYDLGGPATRCVHAWGDGGLYDYRFEYQRDPRVTRFTDSLGHLWITEMDDAGFVTAEVDPLGGRTLYEYDKAGRTSAVVDPAGNRSEWEYDEIGNVTREAASDGAVHSYAYDARGRLIAHTDPNGNTWRQEWNDRAQLVRRVQPDGGTWIIEYSIEGDAVRVRNPRGHAERFVYDERGNLVERVAASGSRTRFAHDLAGNPVLQVDPDGAASRFEYDACSRTIRRLRPSGALEELSYDASGNLIRVRDPRGLETRFDYVGLDEIGRRIDPDGSIVQYRYDTEERLVEVVDRKGRTFQLVRDALGRVVREIDYWGGERHLAYDEAGFLVERIDEVGGRTTFVLDGVGRVLERSGSDGCRELFLYDRAGNLVRAENEGGTAVRSYDALGRIVREEQPHGYVEYAFDANGNLARRESSLGHTVWLEYDANDDLGEIRMDERRLVRIERDAARRMISEELGAQLSRHYRYDADGRLRHQELRQGGILLRSRSYRYDPAGELEEWRDSRRSGCTLRHDPLGRVAAFRMPGDPAEVAVPEPEERPGVGELSRLCERHGQQFGFDRAGRLVSRRQGDAETTFEWSCFGRLVRATPPEAPPCDFRYDPLGRRLSKHSGVGETRFVWDGLRLLGELTAGGAREYTFYPGTFVPFAWIEADGTLRLYDTDVAGLPREVFGERGEVLWHAEYDGTGRLVHHHRREVDNPLRFQNQYFDEETGLSYNLGRYYDPELGCFTSKDPLGLRAGEELHRYAPNPWTWADPLGLTCADELVDLASPARRAHILEGEVLPGGRYSGGHRPGTGFPGKSEFPAGWSDDQIMHHVSDVATDPLSTVRPGRGSDVFVSGTREGTDIEVLIRRGEIWTAYPTNVPRNP